MGAVPLWFAGDTHLYFSLLQGLAGAMWGLQFCLNAATTFSKLKVNTQKMEVFGLVVTQFEVGMALS